MQLLEMKNLHFRGGISWSMLQASCNFYKLPTCTERQLLAVTTSAPDRHPACLPFYLSLQPGNLLCSLTTWRILLPPAWADKASCTSLLQPACICSMIHWLPVYNAITTTFCGRLHGLLLHAVW